MDIAKIRKKAREKQEKEKGAGGGTPVDAGTDAPGGHVFHEGHVPETHEEIDDEASLSSSAGEKSGEVPPPLPGAEVTEGTSGGKEAPVAEDAALELLTFSLSNEEFAFRISEVEEIIRYQRITGVPTTPNYVRGITSLRGKIIPVIDLKSRLALKGPVKPEQEREEKEDKRILILSGPKGMIGATIDKVLGVVRFPASAVLDPPAHLTENELKHIEGVVILEKRFISIIRSDDALEIELT